jgi:hypothetical protein
VRQVVLLSLILCALSCTKRSEAPATPSSAPSTPRYYIVGKNGAQTFEAKPTKLLPGFGVSIVEQFKTGGELHGRSTLGREFAMHDLELAKPSRFSGVDVGDKGLSFGWAVRDGAPVYAQPNKKTKPVARKSRYALVPLPTLDGPQGFYRVAEGWMSETDLAVPHLSSRPPLVVGDEHWLDVELRTQTLVAYVGDRPVFATLVATGVGADGSAFATPKGIHRIRAKLRATTMDNLEHTDVVPYSYEEVPFTQYIGRVALHGAFWHDQFGAPRSHGCINLSLADAQRMFAFTKPTLLEGVDELAATERNPGTVVRVR